MSKLSKLEEFKQKFKDEMQVDWNPTEFDWNALSFVLASTFCQYFDCWWDSEKYNWRFDSWALAKHCSKHFRKWWDPKRFNWFYARDLARYCCQYFDIWWNEDLYWVDEDSVGALFEHCKAYKHKWYTKKLISKLY